MAVTVSVRGDCALTSLVRLARHCEDVGLVGQVVATFHCDDIRPSTSVCDWLRREMPTLRAPLSAVRVACTTGQFREARSHLRLPDPLRDQFSGGVVIWGICPRKQVPADLSQPTLEITKGFDERIRIGLD